MESGGAAPTHADTSAGEYSGGGDAELFLRADFVALADEWLGHVLNETKAGGSPEMSHSVRKFQFRLDSDASAKKVC